jgi:hypothetical protein
MKRKFEETSQLCNDLRSVFADVIQLKKNGGGNKEAYAQATNKGVAKLLGLKRASGIIHTRLTQFLNNTIKKIKMRNNFS